MDRAVGGTEVRELPGGGTEAPGELPGGGTDALRELPGGGTEARGELPGGGTDALGELPGGGADPRGELAGGGTEVRRTGLDSIGLSSAWISACSASASARVEPSPAASST